MNPAMEWAKAWSWPVLVTGLVYAGHLWFGGNSSFAALCLAALQALLLAGVIIGYGLPRPTWRDRTLAALAGMLLLTLLIAVVSMTPLYAGGPHPVWSYVQGSPAGALDRSAVIIELFKLLGLAAIFCVGTSLGGSADAGIRTVRCIVWAGGGFALFAVLDFLSRSDAWSDPRLNARLSSANCAATVFGMLICLTLPLLLATGRRSARSALEDRLLKYAAPSALLLLLSGCLVLTASRGGIISTLVGLAVLAGLLTVVGRLKLPLLLMTLGAFALSAGGLLLFKGQLALERFGGMAIDQDPRSTIFAQIWGAIQQAPLQGFGLGSFAELNHLILMPVTFAQTWAVRDVHNVYLQWLIEAGVAGAAVMFTLIVLVVSSASVGFFRSARGKVWLAALLAADAVVLLHGFSDFALQVPSIAAFWALLLGLQLGMTFQPRSRPSAPRRRSSSRRRRTVDQVTAEKTHPTSSRASMGPLIRG